MKLFHAAAITVFCAVGVLAGCGANGTAGNPTSKPSNAQSVPQSAKIASNVRASAAIDAATISTRPSPRLDADSLEAFATREEKILMSATGDLNGDGRIDAVIVVSPPGSSRDKLGEGPARTVMLLIGDESGQLQKVKQNDVIVPCEMCGGLAGDPFGYVRVDADGFTISNGSGSRERWWNEFKFTYSPKLKDWVLIKIERGVSDQFSGKKKSETLGPKEFGLITFSELNPSSLPDLILP